MNADDVAALTNRLVSTWPLGVKGHIWTAELTRLTDVDAAGAAYRQLAEIDDRPPSVARFLEAYRAIVNPPRRGIPRPEDTGPPRSRSEVIDYLQWRVDTGAATPDDIAALAGLTGLHRHLEPPLEHPVLQPPLDLDDAEP